jgi:DNA-binding transcriptional LysR family regulator
VSLFIGPPRDETPGLRRQRLFTDRLVVMARASNPLLRGELTLERYLGAQHILVSPRGLRGGFVDDALAKRGLSRRVVLEVPHFLVALLVAATSDLLVTMPSRLAEQAGKLLGIAVKPLPLDLASVEFVLLWHERDHADDAHVWLRREVTAAARGA